jgi:hypothetical protein
MVLTVELVDFFWYTLECIVVLRAPKKGRSVFCHKDGRVLCVDEFFLLILRRLWCSPSLRRSMVSLLGNGKSIRRKNFLVDSYTARGPATGHMC